MNEPQYAERRELDGLGLRVSDLDRQEAACRAEMIQRHANHEMRADSQNEDIKKLFNIMDTVKNGISDLKVTNGRQNGGLAVLMVVLTILVPILIKLLHIQ